jgi:hypothetical protein
MRHTSKFLTAVFLLALVANFAGCASAFVSTARAVDAQKATVEDAYRQLVRQHNAKQVPDAIFKTGTGIYDLWAKSENLAAGVLASWKSEIDRGVPVSVQDKVNAVLRAVLANGAAFLKYVDGLAGVKTSGAPDPATAPTSSLPFALAVLPLGVAALPSLRRRGDGWYVVMRDRNCQDLYIPAISGGAGPSIDQILAIVGTVSTLLTGLLNNGNVAAALHVAGTMTGKIRDWIEGSGPDFAAMTPAEIEAHFTAKTSDEIRREEGDPTMPPA